jgi:hypothetical protein
MIAYLRNINPETKPVLANFIPTWNLSTSSCVNLFLSSFLFREYDNYIQSREYDNYIQSRKYDNYIQSRNSHVNMTIIYSHVTVT